MAGVINEDEVEIVDFGIEHFVMNLVGVGTIILIGGAFGKVLEALAMALAIFPLRKYAGGFHARKIRTCYLLSCCIISLAFVIENQINMQFIAWIILSMGSVVTILIFSPVECRNKMLDGLEKKEYKKRTLQVMLAEIILVFIFCMFHFAKIVMGILMSWWIVAIALLVGMVDLYYFNCHI